MRSLVILLSLFTLACSNADPGPNPTATPSQTNSNLEWSEGSDGAMVALYKNVVAYKCWPVKGGYDCLQAVDLHGPDEVFFDAAVAFTRGTVTKLPVEPFVTLVPAPYAQYNCSIRNGIMTEQISSNHHTLTETSSGFPPTYSGPWSVDFVNDFYSSNHLRGIESYFNCGALGAVISRGSLETLRTNLINHALLTPSEDALADPLADAAVAMATSEP